MEARMLLDGSMHVCGVKPDHVPGQNLSGKRQWILDASQEDITAIAKKGWCHELLPGNVLAIPSGFWVITTALNAGYGLRWSVSSDANDTNRVSSMLSGALASFPELSGDNLGWVQFLRFLSDA